MEKLRKMSEGQEQYGGWAKVNYEHLILKGEAFEDPEFRPTIASLIHPDELKDTKIASATKKMWKDKVTWKRISEIYPDANVYSEDISTDDVAPGVFDQSYMQAALSRIAQDSGMAIKKCFVTKDINTVGVYVLTIHVDGSPKNVTIDDYVPYFESSKQPAFINTGTKSIWALLLEKAWAKVCGSYERAHSMD